LAEAVIGRTSDAIDLTHRSASSVKISCNLETTALQSLISGDLVFTESDTHGCHFTIVQANNYSSSVWILSLSKVNVYG
jgi:hypothetical protein